MDYSKLSLLKSKMRQNALSPFRQEPRDPFGEPSAPVRPSADSFQRRAGPAPTSQPQPSPQLADIPIVALNRSRPAAPPVPEILTPDALIPCAECGRSFNQESIAVHKRVCRKVFKQRRKAFDSAKVRLSAIEDDIKASGGVLPAPLRRNQRVPSAPPKPLKTNWRNKSAQFRAAIGSVTGGWSENKGAYGGSGNAVVDSSLMPCPHCGRSFNEDAAKRHIPVCLKLFANRGGRLSKGDGQLSHSTATKVGGGTGGYGSFGAPLVRRAPAYR